MRSRAKSSVPTRVMSAWNASASRSNCSLMCSSKVCGTPTGTSRFSGATVDAFIAISSRRSISRTFSAYSSRRGAVGRADVAAQAVERAAQRVEDALVALAARGALFGGAAVAEHALEHHLRIELHRQRRRGRRPRDGVRVGAAVALAAVARVGARILHRQLHRRHQVLAPDLLRDELVDGRAAVDVGAGGLPRLHART